MWQLNNLRLGKSLSSSGFGVTAGNPSLNLNFLGTSTLNPLVTFTRASSGTYFDSTGTLQTAGNNTARFDYNPSTLASRGLLIEEQRTNLLLRSEDFGNASWVKAALSVTTNSTTAKDGTITADLLIPNATSTDHLVAQSIGSVASGATYTFSVFAKAEGYSWIRLSFGSAAGGGYSFFNLGTGALGASSGATSTIQDVGAGWYRCSITRTTTTLGDLSGDVYVNSSNSQFGWAGNGTSGVYVWGAQLEAGAFATSYIATTAASATRSADVASVNTLSPWYNASAGTLFNEVMLYALPPTGTFPTYSEINDGTTANRISLSSNQFANHRVGARDTGGVFIDQNAGGSISVNVASRWALAYANANYAASANGGAVVTSTTAGLPSGLNQMLIGRGSGANQASGWIRRITYYPRRLSNAALQSLTA